jgi:hypothetical protein
MEPTKTIVHFHTGRGGRFNNAGHTTFCGTKTIGEVLQIADQSGQWNFYRDRDAKGRFCAPYYADHNGRELISANDVESGVGIIDWDGDYDTDVCMLLSECSEAELIKIAASNEWNAHALLQEFFDTQTELKVDWKAFDGNFHDLIWEYFNGLTIDITEYYQLEEAD